MSDTFNHECDAYESYEAQGGWGADCGNNRRGLNLIDRNYYDKNVEFKVLQENESRCIVEYKDLSLAIPKSIIRGRVKAGSFYKGKVHRNTFIKICNARRKIPTFFEVIEISKEIK